MLRSLRAEPTTESPSLKRVAQSKRYPVWRTSHPFEEGVAFRLICWFVPEGDELVVALFAGDKARIGDVWYDSVGHRADAIIEQWLRDEKRRQDDEQEDS